MSDVAETFIAGNLAVYGHPTSTVPMGGSVDPQAVVDSVGTVRGVSGNTTDLRRPLP